MRFPGRGESVWRPAELLHKSGLPDGIADWLLDSASLTRRLREACSGRFSVQVLAQSWRVPMACERTPLGLPPRRRALVREVLLCCDGEPWVFARTVIPRPTLKGPSGRLSLLGNRPLGELLFRDPHVRRGPLEVTCAARLGRGHCPDPEAEIWGRRSRFLLAGRPLLVSEFFIAALPRHPARD